MTVKSVGDTVRFCDYTLDVANAQLWRGGQVVPLRAKAFDLLHYLAERPGRLVTKADLLDAVWPDTAVSEWVLTTTVRDLRDALGDDARQPRVIETVHRRGYRFIAAISPLAQRDSARRTTLVGRQAELETLTRWWQQAQAGERQLVFVIG